MHIFKQEFDINYFLKEKIIIEHFPLHNFA